MRDRHMRGLEGGISQLAPSMVDGYVDHPAVQDSNLPYILTPDIQQLRRESMNQFQELPTDMLKRFGFKGVQGQKFLTLKKTSRWIIWGISFKS